MTQNIQPMDATPSVYPSSGKARVLLVDDHLVLRQGMAAIINEQPDLAVCGEADGVFSAMEAVKALRPDVALVDLSIRDGDGLELLRLLKQQYPAVRSLVLSMYDEAIYAERALRAGARGYIMKVEAAQTVTDGIRAVLRGENFVSPDFAVRNAAVLNGSRRTEEAEFERMHDSARLSDRELEVLRWVGRGLSTREIGQELFISIKTVEAHREHIKQKLDLSTSGELLRYAISHNRLHG